MNTMKEFLAIALSKKLYFLILLLPINSYARLMLEPSLNYYQGSFEVADRSGDFHGKVAGLKIGYMGQFFMAGINLEKGQYFYDDDISTNDYEQFDGGGVGTYLAFHFFDRFRLLTSYLNSSLEPVDNNDTRYFGQHFSASLGIRIIDGLMFNFEKFSNQFTQLEDDSTGKTEGLDDNIKTQGENFSLSYIIAID